MLPAMRNGFTGADQSAGSAATAGNATATVMTAASARLLKLHPRLAPIKVAVLPLVKKDGMPEFGLSIYRELKSAGIPAYYDQQAAIGKRYRRQDEVGTPFGVTIDHQTMEDDTVTLRDRDTTQQERVPIAALVATLIDRIGWYREG